MNEIIERIGLLPREQVFAWREAHRTGSDEPLSLRWETSPMWTPEHREAVAKALSDWALEQSDAREVLRTIARADRRIGVWLACASARTTLRYVPVGEDRPRLAIETAERWTRGDATESECIAAADATYTAYVADAGADAAVAAYAAAYAAAAAYSSAADAAAYSADYAARAATRAAAPSAEKYRAIRDAELILLREVVANACLTFPG